MQCSNEDESHSAQDCDGDRPSDDDLPPIDDAPSRRRNASVPASLLIATLALACSSAGSPVTSPGAGHPAGDRPPALAAARSSSAAPTPSAFVDASDGATSPNRPSRPAALKTFPSRDGQQGDRASMSCGRYVVERRDEPNAFGHVRVFGPDGALAYDARPREQIDDYDVAWCFDITGDGVPELALLYSTGGAHCCHKSIVLSLGATVTRLFDFEAGNAGGLVPVDVDGDGRWELVGEDDVLVAQGRLPYAFTRFLPVIFSVRGTSIVRSTRRYAAFLRGERDAAKAELAECDGDPTCLQSIGEYVLGLSLLLGDWDAERGRLNLPEPTRAQLEKIRRPLAAHLER